MKTCAVLVTYGNRFHLISQVIYSLLIQEVDKIVVVDNNSVTDDAEKLLALSKELGNKIQLITLTENTGSASGFKIGIEAAVKTDCDFIWLLDDDNRPEHNALNALKEFWLEFKKDEKEITFALLSNRVDSKVFKIAVEKNEPDYVLSPKNNFLGFHVKQLLAKLSERIRIFNHQSQIGTKKKYGKVTVAPYGGFFFHKKLLSKTDLPEEKYYLYMDDFDFTYRFTKSGGEIYLVLQSKIKDIDAHFYDKKKTLFYHSILDSESDFRIFYANRNTLYFYNKFFLTNKFIFYLNKIIFLFLITTVGIFRGKWKRLKLLYRAIDDAHEKRMGKTII